MNRSNTIFSERPGENEFRRECYRCFRAASVCICGRFKVRVDNRTRLIVIQHHREVTHPIGTARIAKLGFQNVEIRVARRHLDLQVNSSCPPNTALLYPHSKAVELENVVPVEVPKALIVLDGTWAQASSMYRANHWLHEIPHVVIRPKQESNYRIRRQPKSGCLSTIEALVQSLATIEPETAGLDGLLRVFGEMVDEQIHAESLNRSKQS